MNLNAIDTDELKIIATILQDGLVEVSEVKYLPSIRSFIIMITRFMWAEKIINKENKRVKAGLVFEDVLSVFSKNIDQMNKSNTLELMTFNYFPTKTKNIEIQLLFKNDAIIKLETEIIKCKLQDQGKPWSVKIVE